MGPKVYSSVDSSRKGGPLTAAGLLGGPSTILGADSAQGGGFAWLQGRGGI